MNNKFLVADLSSIETRIGGWLASCKPLMDVFVPYTSSDGKYHPNGRDAYLSFAATGMYFTPYEKLYLDKEGVNGKEAKADAKRKRQVAKPGVLGAIYGLSGGGWGRSKKGYKDHEENCKNKKTCGCPMIYDKVKTGLWKYADDMGVEMSQEQANGVVRMFREAYPEIPAFWKVLEDAVADVMRGTNTIRKIGPNGCIVIDKIGIEGRYPLMRMRLPSGRYLHYLDARMESCLMPWKKEDGSDVYKENLVYAGTNQETKQWEIWIQTRGSKLFENLVQAIARDVLTVFLVELEVRDYNVVGHVHDEIICKVPNDLFSPTLEGMIKIMSQPISWAEGLLLGADGFEDVFYHK